MGRRAFFCSRMISRRIVKAPIAPAQGRAYSGAMGYFSLIFLAAAVLIVLGILFFARGGAKTDRGTISPHVTPSRPYAEEATPDRSSVNPPEKVEEAQRHTPPA